MYKRYLDVYKGEEVSLINDFIEFLGLDNVKKKFDDLEVVSINKESIYYKEWFVPNNSFWFGLRKAMIMLDKNEFVRENKDIDIEGMIEVISDFFATIKYMPIEKRKHFKKRIFNEEYLDSIFSEFYTAAHFWGLGFDIYWYGESESRKKRSKSPEFIAKSCTNEVDVECKTKLLGFGRQIELENFYKLADFLSSPLYNPTITGEIGIIVDSKIPSNIDWAEKVLNEITYSIEEKRGRKIEIQDTTLDIKLHFLDDIKIYYHNPNEVIKSPNRIFDRSVIYANKELNKIFNPITLKVSSKKEDTLLKSIHNSLTKANKQLSRKRKGTISCFIPGIDSFEGLGEESGLEMITRRFFNSNAYDSVFGVSYVSNLERIDYGSHVSITRPAIAFYNYNYDLKYGPPFSLVNPDN